VRGKKETDRSRLFQVQERNFDSFLLVIRPILFVEKRQVVDDALVSQRSSCFNDHGSTGREAGEWCGSYVVSDVLRVKKECLHL
jgi:hypothetical protein